MDALPAGDLVVSRGPWDYACWPFADRRAATATTILFILLIFAPPITKKNQSKRAGVCQTFSFWGLHFRISMGIDAGTVPNCNKGFSLSLSAIRDANDRP
jgi:hypothetical protein